MKIRKMNIQRYAYVICVKKFLTVFQKPKIWEFVERKQDCIFTINSCGRNYTSHKKQLPRKLKSRLVII